MSWNYRVMRYAEGTFAPYTHGIHEVYYADDGAVRGFTEQPVCLTAFDPNDLRWRAEEILKAFDRPVLDYKDERDAPTSKAQ